MGYVINCIIIRTR